MSRISRARMLPISLTLLLAIVACTPAAGPGQDGQTATTPPTAMPDTSRLVIIEDNVVDSLDAHVAQRGQANIIIQRINEALVQRDSETLVPGPGLATTWTNPDPRTWEFTLRDGVTFTDGQPFNADVVKHNFDRIMDPELKAAKGASFGRIIESVEVVDDGTVRITTQTPYAMFLERLTTLWMVPIEYDPLHPVGTGPYKFVEWVQGQHVTIERNDEYWGEPATYQEVVYRQILEANTRISELLAGSADIVFGVTPDEVESVETAGKKVFVDEGVSVVEIRTDSLPRGEPSPFTDKRVRQAACYAINKQVIAENILGGYSTVVATNIVPKMFGHDPSVEPYPYDPERARQLLADAGFADGFDVRFLYYPASGFTPQATQAVAEAVADDLNQVGIRADLFSIGAREVGQYTTTGRAGPIFLGGNPNGGFYDGGFGFFYLKEQYASAYFWSEELDEMIQIVETSTDQETRAEALSEIQKYLKEEAPYCWGFTGFDLIGHNPAIDISGADAGADFRVEDIKPT